MPMRVRTPQLLLLILLLLDRAATMRMTRMTRRNALVLPAAIATATPLLPAVADAGLYHLNVKLSVKPNRRDEFIKVIENNAKGTRTAEPLAVEYVWGESTTEPNIFYFSEKYKGRAGFEAHTKSPHFAAWETFVATEPFTAPPVVQFYEER